MNSAVVLLSGGLDSVVCLAEVISKYSKILALTFNYGQKAFESEKIASQKIAKYYNIEHKIIDINWLGNISKSVLNTSFDVPKININDLDNNEISQRTADLVWVPNRNGLFVNIAACYADALNYNKIVIGANKEEGKTFKDNSVNFIKSVNTSLKYSANNRIELVAPLQKLTKEQIVKKGLELNIPFKYIFSCYNNSIRHCGKCESCMRLKRSLEINNRYDIINLLFD